MFASPEEPRDFDPRIDDCLYGRMINGVWHVHARYSGKWAGKKIVTNARWQGLEIARAQGLCPPGVPVFWFANAQSWESAVDKTDWNMTYEQAII